MRLSYYEQQETEMATTELMGMSLMTTLRRGNNQGISTCFGPDD